MLTDLSLNERNIRLLTIELRDARRTGFQIRRRGVENKPVKMK